MKNSLLKIYALVALVAGLLGISFVAGLYVGDRPDSVIASVEEEVSFDSEVNIDLFWKVWDLLDQKHVPAVVGTTTGEITDQDKIYAAIEGLTSSYDDPYTVFFPPRETKIFEEDVSGRFGGIGVEVGKRDDLVTVISPLKGTPADLAGIKAGDVILAVDGKSVTTATVEEAVDLIRGEEGTIVTLTIGREGFGESLKIPIVRAQIEVPAIKTEKLNNVFIIHLYSFSADSPNEFREALRGFIKAKTNKMIIDLRGNPGGYLDAAIDMASWFMPSGNAVVREEFGLDSEEIVHRSKGYNIFTDNLKLAVLIDNGSASASEILAGALKEQIGATLIGMNTYGKGSVQELVRLDGDTSLKVTVARWLTPNGKSISDGGLSPDIEVDLTAEDLKAGLDPQVDKAIEYLKSL